MRTIDLTDSDIKSLIELITKIYKDKEEKNEKLENQNLFKAIVKHISNRKRISVQDVENVINNTYTINKWSAINIILKEYALMCEEKYFESLNGDKTIFYLNSNSLEIKKSIFNKIHSINIAYFRNYEDAKLIYDFLKEDLNDLKC